MAYSSGGVGSGDRVEAALDQLEVGNLLAVELSRDRLDGDQLAIQPAGALRIRVSVQARPQRRAARDQLERGRLLGERLVFDLWRAEVRVDDAILATRPATGR